MTIQTTVNGKTVSFDVEDDSPLLWALREELKLTGTKYGCGIGLCGACTVQVDGKSVRSCSTTVGEIAGKSITTIEGLAPSADIKHALQQAWIKHQVPQCGFCQPGQIMAAAALLTENPKPSDKDIDKAMTNLCRCGTYLRVRAAIRSLATA